MVLKETRSVSLEEVAKIIRKGAILKNLRHHNPRKHPNQRIFVLSIQGYVYAVPYVIDRKRKVLFLKTLYPSRELTKKYLIKTK